MNNPDPMTDRPQCRATNRQGQRCRRPPVPGATVCRLHGGAAPQVRRKAALRLAELVDPAIATLARIMVDPNANDANRLRAVENVMDRAGVPRKVETNDPDTAREILVARLLAIREQREDQAPEGLGLIDPSKEEIADEG